MNEEELSERKPAPNVWLYYLAIVLFTFIPLSVHIYVNWWSALIVWLIFLQLFIRFFVPFGLICLGILFVFPLISLIVLLLMDLALLVNWLRG